MSQADAARDYAKSLRISRQRRDETLQNPCPSPLSNITCPIHSPYMGGNTALGTKKQTTDSAGASTATTSVKQLSSNFKTSSISAGWIWAQRRRDRRENAKEFLRKMLGFAEVDDEVDVRQEVFEEWGLEEVDEDEEDDDEIPPSGRRNQFIAH